MLFTQLNNIFYNVFLRIILNKKLLPKKKSNIFFFNYFCKIIMQIAINNYYIKHIINIKLINANLKK